MAQDRGNKGNKLEQSLLVGWVDQQKSTSSFTRSIVTKCKVQG
jgi:hypothetical protein